MKREVDTLDMQAMSVPYSGCRCHAHGECEVCAELARLADELAGGALRRTGRKEMADVR